VHRRDFGDRRDFNDILEATIGRGGSLELLVQFPMLGQSRRFILVMDIDGRMRAISNATAEGGDQTIKDGKFTFNGSDTPWQTRCH
jgi:hypothetical protein